MIASLDFAVGSAIRVVRKSTGDFAHAWIIRNGKAIEFHEYTDTAACVGAYQKAMSA